MKKYLFYSAFIHVFLIFALLLSLLEFGYLSFNENGKSDYTHVGIYKNEVNKDTKKSSNTDLKHSPLKNTSYQKLETKKVSDSTYSQEKKSSISKKEYKLAKNSSNISIEQDIKDYSLLQKTTGMNGNKKTEKGGNENSEAENIKSSAKPEYGANKKPDYPLVARRRGYEGEVVYNVQVLNDGKVGEMQLLKTSGYTVLDNSAYNALKKWKFIPGKFEGEYIASWVKVPILFKLNDI